MPLILPVALLAEATFLFIAFLNVSRISFKKLEVFIAILALSIVFFAAFVIIPIMQFASITSNVFCISIMIIMAYRKVKKLALCIFYAVFSNIIALFAASIAGTIFVLIMNWYNDNFDVEVFVTDWAFYIPIAVVIFTLTFIFSLVIGRIFNKRIEMLDDSQKKSMGSFLAVGSLITLFPFWVFSFFWEYIFVDPLSPIIGAPIFVIFFVLLGLALIAFTNKVRQEADLRIKDEALRYMQEYTRKIESMASEVRNFRHDHYNLLLSFTGYILDKDWDGLRVFHEKYLEVFKDETKLMHSRRLDTLVNITTPALKSLYIAKIIYAQQLKIDVHVDVPHEIEEIHKDILVDFCRVVGNFLDNAIEACVDNPDSKIELGITTVPEGIMFIFENTCTDPPAEIPQIFERSYSTKGKDRGTGLQNVTQILKKTEALTLKTKFENGNFVHLLTLQKN